jgi:hypothetical protein
MPWKVISFSSLSWGLCGSLFPDARFRIHFRASLRLLAIERGDAVHLPSACRDG